MPLLIGELGDYDLWKCDPEWGVRHEECEHCLGVKHECDPEHCARCGLRACTASLIAEEGDEWECAACNGREDEREQSSLERYQEELRAEHDAEMRRDAFGEP